MLRMSPKKAYHFGHEKRKLELYTDYLISNNGYATATGLSTMLEGEVSHDELPCFLSERDYTSKDLWRQVKSTVRQVEREAGCLIFDDTIQKKAWTDENEIMCWHYDPGKGRAIKGMNVLNAWYHNGKVSVPVAFEVIHKPIRFCDVTTSQACQRGDSKMN